MVTEDPVSTTIFVYESVTLTCQFRGNPEPMIIKWVREHMAHKTLSSTVTTELDKKEGYIVSLGSSKDSYRVWKTCEV
jgi:hypothetical protein